MMIMAPQTTTMITTSIDQDEKTSVMMVSSTAAVLGPIPYAALKYLTKRRSSAILWNVHWLPSTVPYYCSSSMTNMRLRHCVELTKNQQAQPSSKQTCWQSHQCWITLLKERGLHHRSHYFSKHHSKKVLGQMLCQAVRPLKHPKCLFHRLFQVKTIPNPSAVPAQTPLLLQATLKALGQAFCQLKHRILLHPLLQVSIPPLLLQVLLHLAPSECNSKHKS
jgi:hypothetical protein